jgi:predicted enzyme related to lactoylglutathione lyase
MKNQFVWVDIPVANLDRAIAFYSAVIGEKLTKESMPGFSFGLFPHSETSVAGCLTPADDNQPSDKGPLIYLNTEGRIDKAIEAVRTNGGRVLQTKHQIGEHGYRAIVIDSEGNRIALHSQTV